MKKKRPPYPDPKRVKQLSNLIDKYRKNILLTCLTEGITKKDIIYAAKQAEAHDFIMKLEDNFGRKGYEAHLGEQGVKLSGGQRQRIALSRAILKDSPILILDEATSALDSEVEATIQKAFEQVMDGKTVLAIAHRLSTLSNMDRIIVLDRGKIVEQGSHPNLLKHTLSCPEVRKLTQ